MKSFKLVTVVCVLIGCFSFHNSLGQEFITPPSEGKAVIYFVRTSSLGFAMNIRYFEKTKYLGKFNGVNYLRYECDPGKSVFWVKAENIDFIETDLKEGNIYFVVTNAVMGAMSAGVKISEVDYTNERMLSSILKVIEKKEGITFTEEKRKKGQTKMAGVINAGALKVRKKMAKGKKIKRITPELSYPLE